MGMKARVQISRVGAFSSVSQTFQRACAVNTSTMLKEKARGPLSFANSLESETRRRQQLGLHKEGFRLSPIMLAYLRDGLVGILQG